MDKLNGMTVILLECSDFTEPGILRDEIQREVDTAHIVIDGDRLIKNRMCTIHPQKAAGRNLKSGGAQ
ncbi:hypothetical protein IFU23_13945 [Pantoea agglomerans]|uniref:hypothetical protein n=1 Tax=Enterobacter agglomerans TaxID=549 RepID=UPI00177E0AEB|nr:hypothetical protein [Pantoea agglomerans]MBD8159203.1 hypothetical protein [Pantoea agglomerans]MBD8230285.1 hypothetical protein [Pantoea agglomerans]